MGGVGGMGCVDVCQSLAVLADSLFLPVVSFECSEGELLSDTTLFPGFHRMGTKRTRVPDILMFLMDLYAWDHLAIVTSATLSYYDQAVLLQNSLPDFPSTIFSVGDTDWEATLSIMGTIRTQKRRIIYFFGSETLYRRVICASDAVGTLMGLTWISEGIQSRSWWMEDNADLMAIDSTCDGSLITSLYEGALSLTGVAGPIGEDTDYLLPCFGEYTPATLTSYIAEYFLDGYPPTDPNRTVAEPPHDLIVSVAVDGVCVFALMVKSLLEQGLDITELRKPSAAVYDQVLNQIRDLTFKGASGDVAFAGNDVPNFLGTWQVQSGVLTLSGFADVLGNISVSETDGLQNTAWAPAPEDIIPPEEDQFPVWGLVIPAVAFCFGLLCCAFCSYRAVKAAQMEQKDKPQDS